MKKILYVLCLLTTLVACSDDDDKIITDYDKPYTKLPSSELRTLIEDNIIVIYFHLDHLAVRRTFYYLYGFGSFFVILLYFV